jgi:acetolactate synthase-1/2/3 large subunit
VIVVVRDDALGMIRWKQKGEGFRDYGLAFGNPDFVAWAESYGATGHRVAEEGLRPLLEEALAAGGVHLIEAPIDYSPNQDEFG